MTHKESDAITPAHLCHTVSDPIALLFTRVNCNV